jgi:Ni/Co efflux regulator RcnB
MKRIATLAAAAAIIAGFGAASTASAQPYGGYGGAYNNTQNGHYDSRAYDHRDNRGYNGNGYTRHTDWRAGGRIDNNDWRRGQRVDYRRNHLRAPPRGYEWRQVDGNYVLAAAATGLIASIILSQR